MPTAQGVNSTIGPNSVASWVFSKSDQQAFIRASHFLWGRIHLCSCSADSCTGCPNASHKDRIQATKDCLDYHRSLFQDTGERTWKMEASDRDEVCTSCANKIPAGAYHFKNVLTFEIDGRESLGSWHTDCLGRVHYTAHSQSPWSVQQDGPGCTCIADSWQLLGSPVVSFSPGAEKDSLHFFDVERK